MRLWLCMLLALPIASEAQEVKCRIDGKAVYLQSQCAAGQADFNVKPSRGSAGGNPGVPAGIAIQPAPPTARTLAPAPALVVSCDPGGCWDSDGIRYNLTQGKEFLRKDGAACLRNGDKMQCP